MGVVGGILLTVLLLSILVFVHELGHFIAAKLMGIRVLEFALFMGPKIFSFKKGETVYSLRLIPIGGFCSMEGEETSSEDEKSYSNKPWYKKAVVLIAGPAMNIILAILLTVIFFLSEGYSSTRIGDVIPGSKADELGIKPGDKIVAMDGMGVSSSIELGTYEQMYESGENGYTYTIKKSNGEKVDVTGPSVSALGIRTKIYNRKTHDDLNLYVSKIEPDSLAEAEGISIGDKVISLNGTKLENSYQLSYLKSNLEYPFVYEVEKQSGEIVTFTLPNKETQMGISMESKYIYDKMDQSAFTFIGDTLDFTYSLVKVTVKSLVWLITGTVSVDEVGGPVMVAGIVSDTVTSAGSFTTGLLNYILLAILISVNLGVFNILPFPALDGGRLVFAVIEGIRGKKIKPEHEGIVSMIGFVILIGFSIFIFIKDILKLFK